MNEDDCIKRVERFCEKHMDLVQRIEIAKKNAGLTKSISLDPQLTYLNCYDKLKKICKNPPPPGGNNPFRKHVIDTSPK